ncbi:hypothetical protein RHSIM_Rhsim11G0021600 [Rhododendron simsii]|uniref:CCHC-type domain-containing protein n=1 Tax=Rhododendron simsii TaxID=118357 RepID=A0A834G8T9_RHOSS|nr:hypothetical protein RHSIM_Rhsim11G0021600 [Rhododendron simsii]
MEEVEFLDLEEGSGETGEVGNLCLVGKILNPKPLNSQAITNCFSVAWKTRGSFSVTPWNNNIFLFRFEDPEDRSKVLQNRPWSFMNSLMVLQPLVNGMTILDHVFSTCPFWVQIHGLPVGKMNRANAEIIGRRFQRLLALEGSSDGILLDRSFLRVRVEIDLNNPLPKGFWLRKSSVLLKDLWISYKYERLSDFCYGCGRIGHDSRACKFTPRNTELNSGYDPGLRAGNAARSRIPIEVIRHEVDEAEIRVNQLLRRQPEMERADLGARNLNALVEHVVTKDGQPNRTSTGARPPHSHDVVLALHETGVKSSEQEGISLCTNPTNIPRGIFSPYPLNMNVQFQNKGLNLDHFTRLSSPPSSPNSILNPIPNLSRSTNLQTQYFVTEPFESPLSPFNEPTDGNPNMPLIVEISPNPSPTKETPILPSHPSPNVNTNPVSNLLTSTNSSSPGESLASFFNKLLIKRKASDALEEPGRSKILRLCSPVLNPLPSGSDSKPLRVKRHFKRGDASSKAKKCLNVSQGASEMDFCLCDVPVHQAFDKLVGNLQIMETQLVSNTEKGRVAGPEQPPPQC